MGFIVKVTGHADEPQWVGRSTLVGSRRLVPREEAHEFATKDDAAWEIRCLLAVLPAGVVFDLVDE